MQADHHREKSADEEEQGYRHQIQQSNSFVVGGQQPGPYPVGLVQIILFRYFQYRCCGVGVHVISSPILRVPLPRPFQEEATSAAISRKPSDSVSALRSPVPGMSASPAEIPPLFLPWAAGSIREYTH